MTIDNAYGDCPRCPSPDAGWAPFCDSCGETGCADCLLLTVPNHNHDRWIAAKREERAAEMRRFAELGITPW